MWGPGLGHIYAWTRHIKTRKVHDCLNFEAFKIQTTKP